MGGRDENAMGDASYTLAFVDIGDDNDRDSVVYLPSISSVEGTL
jgi:hypothetical protein